MPRLHPCPPTAATPNLQSNLCAREEHLATENKSTVDDETSTPLGATLLFQASSWPHYIN
jgi:hypothetical protein